jgi:cytochrome c oxidase subunit 2
MKGSARLLLPLAAAAFLSMAALPASAVPPNWLPPNVNASYGDRVDGLYFGIYYVVAIFFFLTEGLLVYCIVAFRAKPGKKATYLHGSNTLETVWTVIPALILIGIGVAQAGTWSDIRLHFPSETNPDHCIIQAFPKQFDWNFRYAGKDNAFGTADDVYANSIHVPLGKKVVVKLGSSDVIHSFFVPHARVKLDAVPGMLGRTWFTIDKYSVWDLKTNRMEVLTPEEISKKKVAWALTNGPSRKEWGYTLVEASADAEDAQLKTGMKNYSYKLLPNKTSVWVWHENKMKEVPVGEVDAVFHRYEIVCAELCGLGHSNMRSNVYVDPPEVYKAWYEGSQAGGADVIVNRWQAWWDKVHPTWNKAIE